MDNLAHSLVGLTAAKAGLEKLSPGATTVCVVSANLADADFISLFFGDRWTLLQYHRGITHSIVGTLAIGLVAPVVALFIERIAARARARKPRIRPGGLFLASLIAAATHPILDWTNNYGVRPFLPWSPRWFYGDLVFIVDPYIWLGLGAVAFLLTSDKRWKLIGWAVIGLIATAVISAATRQSGPGFTAVKVALTIWVIAISGVIALRWLGKQQGLGRRAAFTALVALVFYWGVLAAAHAAGARRTLEVAEKIAANNGEQLLRTATMPTEVSPLSWQAVAETNLAVYRFTFILGVGFSDPQATRFPKPAGLEQQLVSVAERDRRARALLGFARFPIARAPSDNCVGQALVQFADLRYTEPGRGRGNFSVNVPIDCPSQ